MTTDAVGEARKFAELVIELIEAQLSLPGLTEADRAGLEEQRDRLMAQLYPKEALKAMERKAARAQRDGFNGYVTYTPELKRILAELSDQVPLNIFRRKVDGLIEFEVKLVFSLDPKELR